MSSSPLVELVSLCTFTPCAHSVSLLPRWTEYRVLGTLTLYRELSLLTHMLKSSTILLKVGSLQNLSLLYLTNEQLFYHQPSQQGSYMLQNLANFQFPKNPWIKCSWVVSKVTKYMMTSYSRHQPRHWPSLVGITNSTIKIFYQL